MVVEVCRTLGYRDLHVFQFLLCWSFGRSFFRAVELTSRTVILPTKFSTGMNVAFGIYISCSLRERYCSRRETPLTVGTAELKRIRTLLQFRKVEEDTCRVQMTCHVLLAKASASTIECLVVRNCCSNCYFKSVVPNGQITVGSCGNERVFKYKFALCRTCIIRVSTRTK